MDTSSGERLWVRARHRAGRFRLALPLGVALSFLSITPGTAAGPTVSAASNGTSFYWSPSESQAEPGGSVTFSNGSATVPHGVSWTGGPETPACTGVPIDDGKPSWSGACSFAQAGTYTYVCYVHPTEMKGRIVVGTGGSPPPGESVPPPTAQVATNVRIPHALHGGVVRGSLDVGSGAGGRLLVEVFATRRILGLGKSGIRRVGRVVRHSLPPGHLAFSVPLSGITHRVLQELGRVPLTAYVAVIAPSGDKATRTRGLILKTGKSSTGR